MRSIYPISLVCIFLSGISAYADPPSLEIESIIEARGDYVAFTPKTDAVAIAYVGMSGIDPFPTDMLKDGKAFILPVRGLKDGQYKFSAIAIKNNEYTRKDFIVKVGTGIIPPGPKPDPIDPPTPKPDPKLDDAPVQTSGLYVVFVTETGQRLNQNQFNILYGATTRTYLDSVCDRFNSQPQWRIVDKDAQSITEPWKDVLKRKKTGIPGLVVISGKKYVYEGDIPASPDELTKLIEKFKPANRTDYCPNCPEPYRYMQTPLRSIDK